MRQSERRSSGWERLLRYLLPARFRSGWGAEIMAALRVEEEAARSRGWASLLRYRLHACRDLARAAWQVRYRGSLGWRQELRFALRSLRRSPSFVATGIVTLGLGLSVSSGMYSALEHTLVRPLPVARPAELLQVRTLLPPDTEAYPLSAVDLLALEESEANTVAGVSYHLPARLDVDVLLRGEEGMQRVNGLRVAPDYFGLLGVVPVIGAGFDTGAEAPPEVMISHRLWHSSYSGDTGVIGRTSDVDARPHTIVGVLPAGFDLPYEGRLPDYWIARRVLPSERDSLDNMYFDVAVRVAPGHSLEEATAEIEAIGRRAAEQRPGTLGERRLEARPVADTVTEGWSAPLTMLAVASLAVLLMACGSVALLMLARQTTREREMALWIALGARRRSIARRLLIEVGIVAAAGLLAGLALAVWGSDALLALVPVAVPRFDGLTLDGSLMLFAATVLVLTTLLAGLAPLLQLRRFDAAAGLKGSGRSVTGADPSRARSTIVALETAMMAVLMVALGLALVSFVRLRGVDPGFRAEERFALQATAPRVGYVPGPEQLARETRFFEEVRERFLSWPGVTSAGLVSNLPLTKGWGGGLWIEGKESRESSVPLLDWEVAGPGYFEAAGIPVLRGRGFESGDHADAPEVVVINETLAQRFFPDRDPIGLSISGESENGPWRRVVGVVGDVRQQGMDSPPNPQMYIAQAQSYAFGSYQLVVAMQSGASVDTAAARQIVRAVDADAVAGEVRPLAALVDASIAGTRLVMTLIALFAALATLLAVTGTWGVVSLVGRSRVREWGVRSALGAGRGRLVVAAARAGARPVAVGLLLGFAAAVAGARWLAGHVYGLSPWEPGVIAVTFIALTVLTSAVVILPAWRAADVDPADAFRES